MSRDRLRAVQALATPLPMLRGFLCKELHRGKDKEKGLSSWAGTLSYRSCGHLR